MLKEVQNIHNLNMQNILVGKMMYKIIYSNVSNERKMQKCPSYLVLILTEQESSS